MTGAGYANCAEGFESCRSFSQYGGSDEVRLNDSAGNDHLTAEIWSTLMEGPSLRIQAIDFDRIETHGLNGGTNLSDLAAVDLRSARLAADRPSREAVAGYRLPSRSRLAERDKSAATR